MSSAIDFEKNNQVNRYTDYDEWAWLYNQTAGPAYKNKQLQFLNRFLLKNIPYNSKILDLCCGTGQLMQPLIDQGFQLTGLDGSEKMLSYAKINAPSADLLLADARSFTSDKKFSAVISTSASLNHIPSIEDLYNIFQQVYIALSHDGYFIFDINHKEQMLAHWNQSYAGEGKINKDYAWLISPSYDESSNIGRFSVDIYKRSEKFHKRDISLNAISRFFLSRNVFKNSRFLLLRNFNSLFTSWDHTKLSYDVYAHDLNKINDLLKKAGFESVELLNISGEKTIDENHSAHFICRKQGA